MRQAEKVFFDNPTKANESIMVELQNKVDAWLKWIEKQSEKELIKNMPPFLDSIPHLRNSKCEISNDIINRLKDEHTEEEFEHFIKIINR